MLSPIQSQRLHQLLDNVDAPSCGKHVVRVGQDGLLRRWHHDTKTASMAPEDTAGDLTQGLGPLRPELRDRATLELAGLDIVLRLRLPKI